MERRSRSADSPPRSHSASGAIWVASAGEHTVTRIDPSDYSTLDDRPRRPADARSGSVRRGAVWVAEKGGTVSRIDPASAGS